MQCVDWNLSVVTNTSWVLRVMRRGPGDTGLRVLPWVFREAEHGESLLQHPSSNKHVIRCISVHTRIMHVARIECPHYSVKDGSKGAAACKMHTCAVQKSRCRQLRHEILRGGIPRLQSICRADRCAVTCADRDDALQPANHTSAPWLKTRLIECVLGQLH